MFKKKQAVHYYLVCTTICVMVFLLGVGFVYPEEKPAGDLIVEKLKSRLEQIEDFSATIVQEKHIAIFNSIIVSSGRLKWKNPGKLFIAMNPPDVSQLFFSENVLWLYYPDEKIAEKYVLKDNQKPFGAFSFFTLLQRLSEGEDVQIITERTDSVVLELKPSGHLFKKIKLWFSKKDLLMEKVEMFETDGDKTVITYSDTIINSGVSDEVFRFIPPKGVTVSSLSDGYPPW